MKSIMYTYNSFEKLITYIFKDHKTIFFVEIYKIIAKNYKIGN